jgi:aminoglycoside phosphotransferase (APT) family kinase protein
LHALLESHGFRAAGFERIPTGKFNDSYFVNLEDGRGAVLRVAPPDDAGFLFYERGMMAQEPGLHRLICERTSIPVAEILFHDDTRSVIDRDALLMSRLHGTAMSDAALTARTMDRILEETGTHLRELHDRCQADQYGYLGEHRCMEPADTWAEAFRTMWGLLIDDIADCGVYDAEEAGRAKALLEKHVEHFDRDVPSCLLHMDIWAQNILVDGHGRVTGIVDWDRALWGDVEIEFAVLDYCGISTGAFWRGYGRERDTSPPARVRGAFYYLYELQKYIVIRMLRSGSPGDARRYKEHAARILDQL